MEKLPAIQFYTGDWRKDLGVQSLDYFDRGVWFEMIVLMHESETRGFLTLNGVAMPERNIAQLLGLSAARFHRTLRKLLDSGVASLDPETGAVMNRRMARDERLRQVRTEAGKRGGNPNLVNQKSKHTSNQSDPPSARAHPEGEDEDEEALHSLKKPVEKPNGRARGISAEMMARGLAERLGISLGYGPQSFNTAVTEVAAAEQKAGRNLEDVAVEMEAAYRFFQQEKASLRFAWGPAKFFGEGHWRDPPGWPRKEKTRQQQIEEWSPKINADHAEDD